ncbi:MAG: GNAT family N-acetyltransferase [Candidatus Thorarchaeota archaeon]|nr:GNAT family N-acetyltransferase [Candidatus Thorarchaeota archaeon]
MGGPPGYSSATWNSKRITSKLVDYYKILNDDVIVGGFIVGFRRKGYQVRERIFVEPDKHRQGIGSKAFNRIFEAYPEAQIWALGTPEWNIQTKNFYEKLGFSQIG